MEFQTNEELLIPHHLGIIMDGNGRWAQIRGLPRSAGHQAGVRVARRVIESCVEFGIHTLTLYAFSTENWNRSPEEVNFIMRLVEEYAAHEFPELQRNGVHLQLMGRRTGLPSSLLNVLDETASKTRDNSRLIVNLAFNYGGRAEIVDAFKAILIAHQQGALDDLQINEKTFAQYLYCPEIPDADLVIRSGGEWRLSNFLLWRAMGAVFLSIPILWPDFQREHLRKAISFYSEQMAEQHVDS